MLLGIPFNIASYALLTIMIANITQLQPNWLIHIGGDVHIYKNHIEGAKEQIKREPFPFPQLKIKRKVENIEDFNYEDFELCDYKYYPKIEFKMAV